jgi:DNA (cytosine-5)-methyltransferase 1
MLNGLDIFSGIGGFTVALSEWVKPVAYCENDPYAQSVLLSRMAFGQLPGAPIWDDIYTLDGKRLAGGVDIIYGGFPCQDVSVAGSKVGLGGKRSNSFWQIVRLASETKAPFVFIENTSGVGRFVSTIRNAFEALGYSCRDGYLSCSDLGGPHVRRRWFMLANADSNAIRVQPGRGGWKDRKKERKPNRYSKKAWRKPIPQLCAMDDGAAVSLAEHRVLGNAVVPHQAREAFVRLMGFGEQRPGFTV